MKEILKKYKKMLIWIFLIGFIVPMIIVHCLFKWHSGNDFLTAEWTAGELLEYIGTMISFLGTIVLGVLALQASQIANDLSKKVIDMEQDKYKLELRPFVLVSNWEAYEVAQNKIMYNPERKYIQIGSYDDKAALCLSLELTNTTQSCISVAYSQGKADDINKSWGNAAINQGNLKMILAPGQKDEFVFYASLDFMKNQFGNRVTVELFLENRFSQRYKETFVIIITALSDNVTKEPGKWYCKLFAQEYTIGRFEKDKNGDPVYNAEEL